MYSGQSTGITLYFYAVQSNCTTDWLLNVTDVTGCQVRTLVTIRPPTCPVSADAVTSDSILAAMLCEVFGTFRFSQKGLLKFLFPYTCACGRHTENAGTSGTSGTSGPSARRRGAGSGRA